jgi:1-acyl-sn-glycerol-3-phosphate acyltransferase
MIKVYKTYPKIAVAIAPEGTRKRVTKFKSGFYYIAHGAGVPLIMVKFDFGNKVVDYSAPFYTSGNYKGDLKLIIEHFKGTQGLNPENACQWENEDI